MLIAETISCVDDQGFKFKLKIKKKQLKKLDIINECMFYNLKGPLCALCYFSSYACNDIYGN